MWGDNRYWSPSPIKSRHIPGVSPTPRLNNSDPFAGGGLNPRGEHAR